MRIKVTKNSKANSLPVRSEVRCTRYVFEIDLLEDEDLFKKSYSSLST